MNKLVSKATKDLTKITTRIVVENLEKEAIPIVKNMIMNDYEMLLNGRVTDRNSRTNPEDYMDEFESSLSVFKFVINTENGIRFVVPDMENFNFSGKLRVIKDILEGTAGNYVEVDMKQIEKIYKKRPTTIEYFDSSVPLEERIIKLRKTLDVINRLKENNIPIVDYPFSNTPPIDIFYNTSRYVEKELLKKIINESLEVSSKEFSKSFS
jgi:hypothetical protein